jgi:hypothetical protein
MSIFGTIVSAIFHHADSPPPASAAPPASSSTPASASAPTTQPAAPAGTVDVAAVMDKLEAQSSEKGLDWRHSIVDMMKLLKLDSSLHARKELAQELHYSGNMNDSASMNVWLHGQVMTKLAQNGGKVPSDLMH